MDFDSGSEVEAVQAQAAAASLPLAASLVDEDDEMLLVLTLSSHPYRSVTDPGLNPSKTAIYRARRMRTNPGIQGSSVRASAATIAAETFKTIKRNMEQHGLRTSHLWPQNFQWLLPKSGATQEQLRIFCALRDHPLIVPNGDLERILELEHSTVNSPPTPPGQHFYSRSWGLTHYQLQKVIEFMAQQDVLLSEAVHWKITLTIHNSSTQPCTFTIRYIATVSGPERPIDRHIGDLAADKRPSGVLLEFVAAVEQLFPEVAAAAQVHLIKQASIDEDGASYLAEDVERVLIEFFDHRSLLNRARGGYYVSFVPFAEDVTLFENLHTRYYSRFMAGACDVGTDPQMAVALIDHFEEIQTYANSNPSLTGTIQHRFTDGVRDTARTSGEPMLYHGTAILVMLGKDITYEQYLGETTYFGCNSRSSYLVHDFLSRLASTEETNSGASWDLRAFRPRHVALTNLWPWLWHPRDSLADALRFARQYLSIVRPLIVATCSRPITSAVRANLQNESENDEDSAFLAIPHIDPGFEKYCGAGLSQIVLRFMDLTWQITLHLADEARKLLDEDHAKGVTRTRKAQCIEILRKIQNLRVSDPDMRAFMANFRDTGNALRDAWARMHRRPEFEDYRPLLDEDGRARIAAIGRAEGLPQSYVRAQQLEKLWTRNVHDLHLVIPHQPERKEEWMEEFLGLQQGQLLFLQVITGLPQDRYLQEMLQLQATSTKDLQGLNIDFNAEGFFSVRWLKDDGSAITFRFKCNTGVIPLRPQEVRALSFSGSGIDVVNAAGSAILGVANSAGATISCSRFDRHAQTEDLWDMWVAVRRANGHTALRPEQPAVVQWQGEKGVGAVNVDSKEEKPKQNRPPKILDALYLLDKFLMERFPLGGHFRTASRERKPDSTEDLQAFVTFLKRPEYFGHPYASFWISCFDNDYIWDKKILGRNLAVLRRVRTVFTHTRHGAGKVAETSYILGPPGTSGVEEEEEPTSDDDNAGRDGRPWGTRKGVKFVDHGKKSEMPRQNRPPKRLDANWLLVEFLNETFPNGGVFRTASKSKFPDSPDHVQAFLDFIRRDENNGHPYAAAFINELEPSSIPGKASTPPRINVLFNNIRVYRSCTKKRNRKVDRQTKKEISEQVYTIGAPGTALPYDEAAVNDEIQEQQDRASKRAASAKAKKKVADDEDDSGDDQPANPAKAALKGGTKATPKDTKGSKGKKRAAQSDDEDEDAPPKGRDCSKRSRAYLTAPNDTRSRK
ncbi:unnamed protein product [Aureobasidium mustum]|uniref:Uncharacterized protein n=1 Tax=Aureobasidium mustum TaxID=2773714 RepID=A0A9N8K064_9PEZI|nr:unnamed protein product [Aureobasidium mustum]